jgi:fumarylacetoacetate (FAA) hydrolase family protein
MELTPTTVLPRDTEQATLVGRVWRPDVEGPSVVTLRGEDLFDISAVAATVSELLNAADPVALVQEATGECLGPVERIVANSAHDRRAATCPWLLAPADLQPVKACGVTFIASLLERVIEEQAKGDPAAAESIRGTITAQIGTDLSALVPGSAEAEKLKAALIQRGVWSQYLEVGIGPDAEVFNKAQPMSSVGCGAEVGLHPRSEWNNPEPEVVLVISVRGRIVGATLGNDVNLRDFEGRSALLLGKAKDNNASCAIGPFVRLLDQSFTLADLKATEVAMRVEGRDGFRLQGASSLAKISRDIENLVTQAMGPAHQYPDGLLLFTGTMFAPVEDRDAPGGGFTHKEGDLVTIASPRLGALSNRVTTSDKADPWTFGTGALMRNLTKRGLLG